MDLDEMRTFYSCLYRSVLFPRRFYEFDASGKPGIIWIAYRFYQRLRRRQIILYLVLFVCSTLSAHLVHAYAAASNQFSIQNVATCLPQFYPLTANKLMAKLGIIHHPGR